MSYYVRFISTSTIPDLEAICSAVRDQDGLSCEMEAQGADALDILETTGTLASVEINRPGMDELFEEEIEEFKELIEDGTGDREKVLSVLANAQCIVAFQVLFGEKGFENALEKLNPIFSWLTSFYDGLLQDDEYGFFDQGKLILEIE